MQRYGLNVALNGDALTLVRRICCSSISASRGTPNAICEKAPPFQRQSISLVPDRGMKWGVLSVALLSYTYVNKKFQVFVSISSCMSRHRLSCVQTRVTPACFISRKPVKPNRSFLADPKQTGPTRRTSRLTICSTHYTIVSIENDD